MPTAKFLIDNVEKLLNNIFVQQRQLTHVPSQQNFYAELPQQELGECFRTTFAYFKTLNSQHFHYILLYVYTNIHRSV